jgi:hypothetical protein
MLLEAAFALDIWFKDDAQTIHFKFVPVEDVIEQYNLFVEADGYVQSHGNSRDNQVTLFYDR